MFGWLRRLFGIAKAEANSALDKMEDPVKMTEQGIKDLKEDLRKSLQSLAEVKSMTIKARRELEVTKKTATDYENKAILLLQKAQSGELESSEADRLASQALGKKEQLLSRVTTQEKNVNQYEQMTSKMEVNVQTLKSQISEWENELKTLKARATVSKASQKVNKQMARVDSNDTLARLERMKEKVAEQEALAESYAEVADMDKSVDDEIDQALGESASSDSLSQLKAKMAEQQALKENNSTEKSEPSNNGEESSTTKVEQPSSELDKLKAQLKNVNNSSSSKASESSSSSEEKTSE